MRRRHGEANPDALAEIEASPRTVVTANGSTVRGKSAIGRKLMPEVAKSCETTNAAKIAETLTATRHADP